MVVIELQQVRLQGFHGVYPGEKKTGSTYEVSVKVTYDENGTSFDNLKDTIDYVKVLDIVKQRMKEPSGLLEKVADDIIHNIRHHYTFTKEISVSIYKLDAPVENFQGKIGVTLHKQF